MRTNLSIAAESSFVYHGLYLNLSIFKSIVGMLFPCIRTEIMELSRNLYVFSLNVYTNAV